MEIKHKSWKNVYEELLNPVKFPDFTLAKHALLPA
jgi:hypothetical protein